MQKVKVLAVSYTQYAGENVRTSQAETTVFPLNTTSAYYTKAYPTASTHYSQLPCGVCRVGGWVGGWTGGWGGGRTFQPSYGGQHNFVKMSAKRHFILFLIKKK